MSNKAPISNNSSINSNSQQRNHTLSKLSNRQLTSQRGNSNSRPLAASYSLPPTTPLASATTIFSDYFANPSSSSDKNLQQAQKVIVKMHEIMDLKDTEIILLKKELRDCRTSVSVYVVNSCCCSFLIDEWRTVDESGFGMFCLFLWFASRKRSEECSEQIRTWCEAKTLVLLNSVRI